MKIEKRIHNGYKEFVEAQAEGYTKMPELFGKWQYIFTEDKKKISLVRLKDCFNKNWYWEIAVFKSDGSIDGESIERFRSKKNAEIRIRELFA